MFSIFRILLTTMGCYIQQEYNCCCSLRTGTLITSTILCFVTIAFLFAFLPVINIIFASVDNVFSTEHPDEVLKQFQNHSAELDSDSLVPRLAYAVIYLLIVMILALGVAKNNNKYLLPWLVFMGAHCVAGTAVTIGILVFVIFIFVNIISKLVFTIMFFISLLITVIWWYFFLCIWSYYHDLHEAEVFKIKQETTETAV